MEKIQAKIIIDRWLDGEYCLNNEVIKLTKKKNEINITFKEKDGDKENESNK